MNRTRQPLETTQCRRCLRHVSFLNGGQRMTDRYQRGGVGVSVWLGGVARGRNLDCSEKSDLPPKQGQNRVPKRIGAGFREALLQIGQILSPLPRIAELELQQHS